MAEEGKMTFTFLDDEGNPIVDPNQEKEEGSQEEGQEESQEESQEDENQEDSTTASDEGDESEAEAGSEESEGEEESSEEIEEDEPEVEEEDESEPEVEEEQDVVDYDELPESVQKYLDFMEDTGGSLEDFVNINQDLSKLSQDDVIGRFLKQKYPTLDGSDIAYEIESRFGVTEDDTDAEVRRKNVDKKKFYAEALATLKSGSEKYKADLGSRNVLPAQAKEALQFKQTYETQQTEQAKKLEAVRSSFVKETNKLLGKNFKGFEVKVGEETVLYKPENVAKVKEQNLNVNNLLNKFLNKDGSVKDVAGYHKALAVASDPEGYAQHFFELGKAAMAEEDAKDSKNVQKTRGTQPKPKSGQPTFKFLDEEGKTPQTGKIKLRHY